MARRRETRRIVLEGDLVRVERTLIEREVKLEEFASSICTLEPVTTGLLPHGCCYHGRSTTTYGERRTLYVIYLTDHLQTMRYRPTRQDALTSEERNRIRELRVSWPPTAWFLLFKNAGLSGIWARALKTNLFDLGEGTSVFSTHFPNFYGPGSGGYMCTGSISVDSSLPMYRRVNLTMAHVLNSLWNDDLDTDFESAGVDNLLSWAERSETDHEYWRQINFKRLSLFRGSTADHYETFGSVCQGILGG